MNVVGTLAARIQWVGAARSSAASVVYLLVSRLSTILVNIVTGIIGARALGPTGRGEAGAMVLWAFLISGLLTLGVPAAVRYSIRREPDKTSELFTSALGISAALGGVALMVGLAVVPHALAKYPPPIVGFAQFMMVFAPLMLLNGVLQAFYDSQGDFKRSNGIAYIPPFLTLTALLVLWVSHGISPYSVALSYEVPFALMTVTTLVTLRRFIRVEPEFREHAGSLLRYGIRAYGIDILNALAGQIDQALVVGLLSVTNFGLYAVAVSGSRMLGVLATSLNIVLFPKAAGLDGAAAIELVLRSARFIFAITALGAIGLVIVLPVLISLAYGKEYSSIVVITRWLTIASVFGATTATLSQAFMATGKPGVATMVQCLGLLLTVPLMLVLIPKFGLSGAAYAADISSALRFLAIVAFFPLFLRHPVPNLLLTRQDISTVSGRIRQVRYS